MAIKKFFTTESLKTFVDEIKTFVSNAVSTKANTNHTHTISNVTNLQTSLDLKVNVVSGKGLSTNDYTTTEKNKLANISDSADAVSFSRSLTSGTKIGTITINGTGTDLYAPTDTDTHYTTHMYAGDGSAADKATTNGNTKISVFDNSTIRDSITIKGTGATTVTSDANGVITINSTDNNTTYSAAGSSLGLVKSGGDVTISSGVITVNDDSHNHTIANVDNLQSSLDAKQVTITGGASTITTSNLTANMALVSDGSGKVAVSAVTSTELGYLDGVKSNVQTQLDGKAASSHNHAASNITSGTLSSDRLPTIPIAKGGTGATTAAAALTNLGITATATELNYVDGVTSNIQAQLNGKSGTSHTHSYLPISGGNLTGVLGIGNKYELSPAYNYTNGCLINICAAKSSTMVAIHITGNSYNTSTSPIDSLFQFYDYGDGTIMNCSGINIGLALGTMTVYRYNNRLYAHIKQTADYQTLSFTILTNKSGLTPTLENAIAHTSGYTDLVKITPNKVSMDGHTHNYAGSSSAGGAANSAIKATQDASGNVITSTYATKAELDTAKSNLQTSINGKANSSHTHTIANITNLQTTLDGKAASSHTHSYAGSSSVGGSATSAVKLDTSTAGDANTPVYFTGGKPVACTSLDLNTSGSSASCTGNSATATKLQTARTIALGTGATGTATSFNGTGNITIPVTDVKEAYLSWGGRNLSGSISPLDAACSNVHSANRFAFAKAAGITIEYSTNGSTYSTYSTTDSAKVNLVSGVGSGYYIGARSTSTTVNDKLRITLNATNMGLYTRLQKLLINISTNYATGSNVIVEKSMKGSESTYTTVGTYAISGWSGWNSIPISAAFGGGDTQTYNIANIRLTFGITGVNSSQTSNALTITDIVGIGDTYWSYPSTMAKTGHLYSYDSSQNATFPANVSAQTFTGSGVATLAEVKTYLGI